MHPNNVELEVTVSSSAMLKVIWQAGLAKGRLVVETPHEVAVGSVAHVWLVLPAKRIALDGVVQGCNGHPSGYSVDVHFTDIGSNSALVDEIL
jgi:hypothetical protein